MYDPPFYLFFRLYKYNFIVHTYLGVLYDFFVYRFGRKELLRLGNSDLKPNPLCIDKSKSIQPKSAPLCKGKVWKNHKYKYCAAVKNNLGNRIQERGKTKRSSRFWSWKRVERIKGSVEQRDRRSKSARRANESR